MLFFWNDTRHLVEKVRFSPDNADMTDWKSRFIRSWLDRFLYDWSFKREMKMRTTDEE